MIEGRYISSEAALQNLQVAFRRAFGLFRPRERKLVSDWAAENRVLAEGTSSLPGRYRVEHAPYQKAMMDAVLDFETVTMMTGKRLGKTVVIENIVGYNIDFMPVPQMLVLPTDKIAENWSKIYLSKMIRSCAGLQAKVGESKSRKKGIEILLRLYPGGHLVIVGANSPTSFGTYNAMYVIFDETDKYPLSSGVEGDPMELGKGRAANYPGERRFVQTSTPTISGLSVIEHEFMQSNQSFYYVPCPVCGDVRVMLFSRDSMFKHLRASYLSFDDVNGDWVCLICGNCNAQIGEESKGWMVQRGEWRASKPEVVNHAGFQLNGLYSLLGYSWLEIVAQYLEARQSGQKERMIPFVNTVLGETFTERMRLEITEAEVEGRCEEYTRESVPVACAVLTCGIDVQQLWKEAVVIGWGADEESWVIERKLFHGPYDSFEEWKKVDEWLLRERRYANGMPARIMSVMVDSGAFSNYVYDFCKRKRNQLTFAGKGASGLQRDLVKLADTVMHGFRFGIVGVDVAKTIVYDRLELVKVGDERKGGYMHFAKPYYDSGTNENFGCGSDYFKQLMAEEPEVIVKNGKKTIRWVKKQDRNEVLDCTVYNLAALRGLLLVAKDMSLPLLVERHRKRVELFGVKRGDVSGDDGSERVVEDVTGVKYGNGKRLVKKVKRERWY